MNTDRGGGALLTTAARVAREFQTLDKVPSADLLTFICWANLRPKYCIFYHRIDVKIE